MLAWQAAGDSDQYLEQLEGAPGLTVTSPRWWTLDADGLLVGETDPDFVASAHELGTAGVAVRDQRVPTGPNPPGPRRQDHSAACWPPSSRARPN